MNATIRPYRAQDLGRVLRLWEEPAPLSAGDGLTVDQAVDLISADSTVAIVAEESAGEVVGVAVGESSAVIGWISKRVILPLAHPELASRHAVDSPTALMLFGPPDDLARRSIWERFVSEITDEDVGLDALVAASTRYTPADIEFAASKAAHSAFEREHFDKVCHRATTEDFLAATGPPARG